MMKRSIHRYDTDRKMLVHKVRFLRDNHWTPMEIAAELNLSEPEVREIEHDLDVKTLLD